MENRTCKTCTWWCGEESDTNDFCDEKETFTSAEYYCAKWSQKVTVSNHVTKENMKSLAVLCANKNHLTDSDIMDFCEENNISLRAVSHLLAIACAPKSCTCCKRVDMYPNMPPCTSCSRAHTTDYFEEDQAYNEFAVSVSDLQDELMKLGMHLHR